MIGPGDETFAPMTAEKSHRFAFTGHDPEGRDDEAAATTSDAGRNSP